MTNISASVEKKRIVSIDLVRGIIMIVMALDHTRDYFHTDAFVFDPTNMEKTNAALFLTRWITHFCAPGFVLLAGASMRISLQRKSTKELSRFLLSRGLWLVFLDFVVLRFAFFFNFYYDVTFLSILWLIGMCMVFMSAVIYLHDRAILIAGIIVVSIHDLFSLVPVEPSNPLFAPWTTLMRIGFLSITPDFALIGSYPLIPWLGIMMLGYVLGKLYYENAEAEKRKKILIQSGATAIALFLILRLINVYGDPSPWSTQKNELFTFLSFLNVTKYPVSLSFTLMTIGPLVLLLVWLEKVNSKILNPVLTFGRVPLFYFILHFFLIHAAALILFMNKTQKSFSEIDLHFAKSFGGITPEGGYSLPWVYVAWAGVVLSIYPICKWYERYKQTHTHWWLSYL